VLSLKGANLRIISAYLLLWPAWLALPAFLINGHSGELLLDQQRFPDAIEKFDRAIEIEKEKCVIALSYS